MSRYAPPPRDRSPPRYDRRPSSTFAAGGSSYRGTADSSLPPVDRAPPRGPKADGFRGGFQSTTFARGRGGSIFPGRSADSWDRDRDRDTRAPPPSYRSRDDDRADGWRRDRDLAPSDRPIGLNRDSRSYVGRDRSASPPRTRGDSRESVPSSTGRPSDSAGTHYGSSGRGGLARGGRARSDWDRHGRSSFVGDRDRDLFPNRSRSRDGWREREYDRGRAGVEHDRFDRRDRSRDRDVRASRDHDYRPRDQSPARGAAGPPPARGASPPTTASVSGTPKLDLDSSRRASFAAPSGALSRDSRRDAEGTDYFSPRTDSRRRDLSPSTPYQAPAAPTASASGGLDYGPPPPISSTSASVEKPVSSKPASQKADTPVTPSSATFLPPSGPKADRNSPSASSAQQIKSSHQPDSVPKHEPNRSRPLEAETPVAPSESFSKTADARGETRHPRSSPPPPKTMPAHVPSGPRSSMPSNFKQRLPSTEPPSTQAAPPKPSTDSRPVSIPTGPRLDRETPSKLPAGGSNRSWIVPDYTRAKPSIMSSLNRDRPSLPAPTGPRSQTLLPREEKARIVPLPTQTATGGSSPTIIPAKRLLPSDADSPPPVSGTPPAKELDVEMSLAVSSDDEGDEDEFDEDDFQASEEKYLLERSLIEAKRPPPLLQDHIVRSLLVRIQFLNMLFHDVVPTLKDGEDTVMKDAPQPSQLPQTGLLSPEQMSDEQEEKTEDQEPQPRGRPLSQAPINPIPTPPLEELPYLKREVLGHTVFEDSDDEVQQEATTTLIRQEFESSAFEWQHGLDELKADFKRMYVPWKEEIQSLEQKERELQHVSPTPASPAPSATASITVSAGHERTRGARNTTEADLQAAILMSQQSAKEEEERREREATANSGPNLDTEAVIPSMLKPDEVMLDIFEDTNGLVPLNISLDVFGYIPPEDDFTDEEQAAFIQAYCQTPKKWGKIAEALENRSYQECISHYYLTKNEAKYKETLRRSHPKRRRGRAAATKPRSTALMSELMYGDEAEGNVAVTDTGRPRRAAAPTFGDNGGDSDMGGPAPQAKRLAGNAKDSSTEAPSTRGGRGRKTGPGSKPRRTKAQIQADQQAAALLLPTGTATDGSPQKGLGLARADRTRTLVRPEDGTSKPVVTPGSEVSRMPDGDAHQHHQHHQHHQQQQQYALVEDVRYVHTVPTPAPTNQQTTSYWSVPEQKMFPGLVATYGKDFAAIAEHMKTKTTTMIRNYYNRNVTAESSELNDIAREAERRRAAGEPPYPPPSPAAPTKRRFEASPSIASVIRPAAITPSEPSAFGDVERQPLQPKSGYTEDFPSNAVQRNASGELVVKARRSRDNFRDSQPPLVTLTAKPEEGSPQTNMFSQKPFSGPRSGVFKDEVPMYSVPGQQNIHNVAHEPPSHQHPIRPNEYRAPEIISAGPAQARSPQQVPLGGHLREPAIASKQASGKPLGQMQGQPDKYGVLGYQHQHQHQHQPNKNVNVNVGIGISHVPPPPARPQVAQPSEKELAPGRRFDASLSFAVSRSPALTQVQPIGPMRKEEPAPLSAHAPSSQPPKLAPVKRSNILSILNNDPEPAKGPSSTSDVPTHSSVSSPQPPGMTTTNQPGQYERRPEYRMEDRSNSYGHEMRSQYSQPPSLSATPQLHRDQAAGFPVSPGPGPGPGPNDAWMARYDPRTQAAPSEPPRPLHQSPRPGPYSLVPPGTPGESREPVQGLRMEQQRSLDTADHRRSLLGSIGRPGNNPSPPPQQSAPSYRSLSNSSHHGRMSSLGYQSSASQPPQISHAHQTQHAASHPHSASPTPASGLHHHQQQQPQPPPPPPPQQQQQQQSRPTFEVHSQRAGTQMHQPHHQPLRPEQREHELALQRQREAEAQHQQSIRVPEREREPLSYHRRDHLYAMENPSRLNPTPPPPTPQAQGQALAQSQSQSQPQPQYHTQHHSHSHSQHAAPHQVQHQPSPPQPQHQHPHHQQQHLSTVSGPGSGGGPHMPGTSRHLGMSHNHISHQHSHSSGHNHSHAHTPQEPLQRSFTPSQHGAGAYGANKSQSHVLQPPSVAPPPPVSQQQQQQQQQQQLQHPSHQHDQRQRPVGAGGAGVAAATSPSGYSLQPGPPPQPPQPPTVAAGMDVAHGRSHAHTHSLGHAHAHTHSHSHNHGHGHYRGLSNDGHAGHSRDMR